MAAAMMGTGHVGQDVHPFFKPKPSKDVSDARLDSEVDEPRRKRQRTGSPEQHPTTSAIQGDWMAQLKAAAQEDPSATATVETTPVRRSAEDQPKSNNDIQAGQRAPGAGLSKETPFEKGAPPGDDTQASAAVANDSVTETPLKRMLRVRPDGRLTSPKFLIEEPAKIPAQSPKSIDPPQKPSWTPPKKILKVHANGKLGSPKARNLPSTSKSKGRKRISNTDTPAKLRQIAVIRYGADEISRTSIGCQINDILAGLASKSQDKTSKPSEPPKSTHPFFTGGLARKQNPKTEPSSNRQASVAETQISRTQQVKPVSGPRESRITSKPPRAADTPNGDHGPGLPTFGTDYAKVNRFPGAQDPIWPPYGMLHVGRPSDISDNFVDQKNVPENYLLSQGQGKMKDTQVQVSSEENVLIDIISLVYLYRNDEQAMRKMTCRDARNFRRPSRIIMTGQDLQKAIGALVASNLSNMRQVGSQDDDDLSGSQFLKPPIHKAVLHVYNAIPQTRTAFDQFQCETQEWVHKYAPKSAENVLQQGYEAIILRDWLKGLTVSSVGTGTTKDSSISAKRGGAKAGRKKRRRAEDLDGFVISDDEETNEMGEITDPEESAFQSPLGRKTVIRTGDVKSGERSTNAVVISGPHGCGKTATVFAVAQELGFEIFEVNAGSRRSGKDILDKVGDMTRNHLVKHRQQEEVAPSNDHSPEILQSDDNLQADLESGRQGTMNSFFQVKPVNKAKQTPHKTKAESKVAGSPPKKESKKKSPKESLSQEKLSKPQSQKQSLILLEEVDILFEEDKMFWATTIDLILRSKRPVIMTCSDERLLPLNEMALYAILRLTSPPTSLATDYLLLVAGSEGHLLSRDTIEMLYTSKGSDLRASMADLNLYCQMGIGDSKGGLEWMLIGEPSMSNSGNDEPLRVISKDTYCSGMGWLGGEAPSSQGHDSLSGVEELCANVWDGWGLDLGAAAALASNEVLSTPEVSREGAWPSLQQFEESCEAFSAADTFSAPVVRRETSFMLNAAQPELTDKMRCNYIEGHNLLQADQKIDHTGVSESLALTLRAASLRRRQSAALPVIRAQTAIEAIPLMIQEQRKPPKMTLPSISSAFDPIARYPNIALGGPRCPSISSFDSPISVIAEDVAPYVRGIVSYDLRLEEQRRQLDSLASRPGRESKKMRTTRASRAALEGGNKANTRRERWFPSNTDFSAVLQTGGKGWQAVALQSLSEQAEGQSLVSDESRRSSIMSMDVSDI